MHQIISLLVWRTQVGVYASQLSQAVFTFHCPFLTAAAGENLTRVLLN